MTQAPATPSFGDVVENGWASEENPTRKGYFVRSFKRIGRINPGLTWLITDRAGYFWELQPRVIGDKLTVTPLADALEAQQARIAELEAVLTLARDFAETEVEMRGAAGSDMSDYQNEAQKVFDDCDAIIRRASDVPPAALLQATGGENGR